MHGRSLRLLPNTLVALTNRSSNRCTRLQSTHLGNGGGKNSSQNMMASLAAAAAANAVAAVSAAGGHMQGAQVGGDWRGPSMFGPGLDGQQLGPGFTSGPTHMPFLPGGGPAAMQQRFMGLPQSARQMPPQMQGAQGLSGHAMMGSQLMYGQSGLPQQVGR